MGGSFGEYVNRYHRVICALSELVSEGTISMEAAKSRLDDLRRFEENLHNPVECRLCKKLRPIVRCAIGCDALGDLNYSCKECEDGMTAQVYDFSPPVECILCEKLKPIVMCKPLGAALGGTTYVCKECDKDV